MPEEDRRPATAGPRRPLTGLWGGAKPATWNRNRAAVGSWLAWCAGRQHWAAPALPAAAQRRRENNDYTKAVSRSRIDRLCRLRDVPLREKTLWRLLYESASRASAVLALNVEDLYLPSKQARITAKGGDTMWITWGDTFVKGTPTWPTCRWGGPFRPAAARRPCLLSGADKAVMDSIPLEGERNCYLSRNGRPMPPRVPAPHWVQTPCRLQENLRAG